MSDYQGPAEIGYAVFPGRGTNYHAMFGGRQIEVALSPKLKNIRIYVDGVRWAPVVEK